MRKLIICTLTATTVVWTSVHAEDIAKTEHRNAIEWLFSDFGTLFDQAATVLSTPKTSGDRPNTEPTNDVDVRVAETTENLPSVPVVNQVPVSDLFKDIDSLFTSVMQSAESNTTEPKAEDKVQAQITEADTVAAGTDERAAESPETAAKAPNAHSNQHGNALTWLLSDLANLFQPTLEIDQSHQLIQSAEAETPAALVQTAEIEDETPVTQPAALNPEPATSERTDEVESFNSKTEKRSAIEWLIDDLVALTATDTMSLQSDDFSDASVEVLAARNGEEEDLAEKTTVKTQPSDTQPLSNQVPSTSEQHGAELTTRIASVFKSDPVFAEEESAATIVSTGKGSPNLFAQLASFFSGSPSETEIDPVMPLGNPGQKAADAETAQSPASETAINETESDTTREVEVGPWTLENDALVFDPSADAVERETRVSVVSKSPDIDMTDHLVAASADKKPTSSSEPSTIEVSENPVIRKREPLAPQHRNHRRLGSPDLSAENEQSVLSHFIDNIFGLDDEPAEAAVDKIVEQAKSKEAPSEVIANKISDRIVPEEKLDLGYTAPALSAPKGELETIGEGPLMSVDLYLGSEVAVGTLYDGSNFDANACLERPLHGSVFCLAPMNWPTDIARAFSLDTSFALPGEGILRFENGKLSRAYAVFEAQDFHDVVKFMQKRFGPPLEREIVWMHMIEAPKLPNTTFRWRAVTADRRDTVVLEVRNYDDLRRSFADLNRGMVRIYRNGSRPIFKHLSTVDLMLMQRRRVAHAPIEVNAPPPQ